jgi:cytosine/adenosine deaminase-related metal-dependent hydrolase
VPAEERTQNLYEEVEPAEAGPPLLEHSEINDLPYVLSGTLLLPEGEVAEGGVFVEDGVIQQVWRGATPTGLEAVTALSTRGIILPGLIDLHNHVAYNFIPQWKPGRLFANRYQWQRDADYRRSVSQPYGAAKAAGLLDEMNKFGEIRALVGGTTSILGAAPSSGSGILLRNIDQTTLGADFLRTHVGAVNEFACSRGKPSCPEQAGEVESLIQQLDRGELRAIVFHVAEGVDPESREEFGWLESRRLLRPEVIVTHATAFGPTEFKKMGQAKMALLWSPRSNIALYGRTTDVRRARAAGVRIALAPDWSPSGSDNLLAEIRYAEDYNRRELGNAFSARELVEMATSVPAELAGRKDRLGVLKAGARADLLVLERVDFDAFRSVVRSDERQVRLVTVNGVPLYGFPSWLDRLGKGGDHEPILVRGRTRALDATVAAEAGVPKGDQTYADIRARLQEVFRPFGNLPGLTANQP